MLNSILLQKLEMNFNVQYAKRRRYVSIKMRYASITIIKQEKFVGGYVEVAMPV